MFKFTYILLLFAFFNAKAEKPTLVWERNDFRWVTALRVYNDSTIIICDGEDESLLMWINSDNGEIIDTLHLGFYSTNFIFTPDSSKLVFEKGISSHVFLDINTKEIVNEINVGRFEFLDNENILIFNDYGLLKMNIVSSVIDTLWDDMTYKGWRHRMLSGSCVSYDKKYALIQYEAWQSPPVEKRKFVVKLFDIQNKKVLTTFDYADYVLFSPNNKIFSIFKLNEGIREFYSIQNLNIPLLTSTSQYLEFSSNGNFIIENHQYLKYFHTLELIYSLEQDFYNQNINEQLNEWYVTFKRYLRKYDITGITGIEGITESNILIVYPNPAENNIFYKLNIISSSYYRIEIINSLGKIIFKNELGYLNKGEYESNISLSNFNSGQYILRISNNKDNSFSKKFIIE